MNESLIIGDTYRAQWEDHCIDNSLGTPTFLECFQFFLTPTAIQTSQIAEQILSRCSDHGTHHLVLKHLCISYTTASNTPPARVAPSTESTTVELFVIYIQTATYDQHISNFGRITTI